MTRKRTTAETIADELTRKRAPALALPVPTSAEMAPPVRRLKLKRNHNRRRKSAFTLAYPDCAGIDVGSASHFVSVPPDRDGQPVREFKSFTDDLVRLADWLVACGIKTVVMESTGVYWIALYELLASRGFDVHLVNARHVKSVSGRKSDVLDCQWLRELMSYGLLKGAFRPAQEVCALRAIMRQRDRLLADQSRQVQHMQKALAEMNIQLANVISDIVGETGQRIVRAIVAGERDRHRLAALRGDRIHASKEDVARSLEGTWRPEHLFALKHAVALFDSYAGLLAECDQELERMLAPLARHDDLSTLGKPKRRGRAKNAPRFDVRTALFRACGVDVTRIDGIDTTTALKVVSETGADLSRFPSVKHFCSWLNLCPNTRISGGKRLKGGEKKRANRAGQAFRQAAVSMQSSKSALGAFFRRKAARLGNGIAVKATAHKLARLFYNALTKGMIYVDHGMAAEDARSAERTLKHLTKRAAALGYMLSPATENAAEAGPSQCVS
jgi:transposase